MAKGSGKSGYFKFAEAVWNSGLKAHSKLVLLAYADYYNWTTKAAAYPSWQTLAKKTGLCKNTVIAHTKFLQDQGWLFHTGFHATGAISTNKWVLAIPNNQSGLPISEVGLPIIFPKTGSKHITITNKGNNEVKQLNELTHLSDAVSLDGKHKGLSEENHYINVFNNIKNFLLVSHRAGTAHIREKE